MICLVMRRYLILVTECYDDLLYSDGGDALLQ